MLIQFTWEECFPVSHSLNIPSNFSFWSYSIGNGVVLPFNLWKFASVIQHDGETIKIVHSVSTEVFQHLIMSWHDWMMLEIIKDVEFWCDVLGFQTESLGNSPQYHKGHYAVHMIPCKIHSSICMNFLTQKTSGIEFWKDEVSVL